MKAKYRWSYGGIDVRVYGGWKEVGGNCVTVSEGKTKIVFDNGLKYGLLKKAFKGRIRPFSVSEMVKLGVVLHSSVFVGSEGLYISHTHLDHMGFLSALPNSIEVFLPDKHYMESVIFEWFRKSNSWFSYILPNKDTPTRTTSVLREDENRVIGIQVSHSVFPSFSFLYIGRNSTLFYSGDFRLRRLGWMVKPLQEQLEKVGVTRVDVAVIEGTNFSGGVEQFPISPTDFKDALKSIMSGFELVFIVSDPLDLEMLSFLISLTRENGRQLAIASPKTAEVLTYWWRRKVLRDLKNVVVVEDFVEKRSTRMKEVSLESEVLKDRDSYVLVVDTKSVLAVTDKLRRLRVWGKEISLSGSVAIMTDSEPLETLRDPDEKVATFWLREFGAQIYRFRLSAHYYPHQLKEVFRLLRPKTVVPVHTTDPSTILELFRKYSRKP